jgi:hypothetical protein
MRYLYLLLLFSLGALLWAAFSIARHIRKHAGAAPTPGFEATEEPAPLAQGQDKILSAADSHKGTQP